MFVFFCQRHLQFFFKLPLFNDINFINNVNGKLSTIVSAENKFVNDYEIDIGAAGLLSINGSSRLDKLKIKMQMYRDLFSAFKVVKTKTTCKNIKKSKTIFFTNLMQF